MDGFFSRLVENGFYLQLSIIKAGSGSDSGPDGESSGPDKKKVQIDKIRVPSALCYPVFLGSTKVTETQKLLYSSL